MMNHTGDDAAPVELVCGHMTPLFTDEDGNKAPVKSVFRDNAYWCSVHGWQVTGAAPTEHFGRNDAES